MLDFVNKTESSTKVKDIVRLMTGFSVEVTAASATKIPDLNQLLRPGTSVYIPFLPNSEMADICNFAAHLRYQGLNPVPHIAARSIPSGQFLDEHLARLRGTAGIDQVLLIGGDISTPVGEFTDTMRILETGLLDRHEIKHVGVAGHPEGSTKISELAIRDALAWKNAFAQHSDAAFYIVTQFCFEAEPIIEWDKRIRLEGNHLPIHVGVPGLATFKTLMTYAKMCGVRASSRFALRNASDVAKLMTLSAPDKLLADLARYMKADADCGIIKVHMYPFGGLRKTALWSQGIVDGKLCMNRDGGFRVDVDLN